MIGQTKLQNKLARLSLDNLPQSLLLVGEFGCGKHLLANSIANKVGLPLMDITDNICLETINSINSRPTPYIYLINGNLTTPADESTLLKTLEEPLKNAFIVILADNKHLLFETIVNRCVVWEFERYTYTELQQFSDNPCLLQFCHTPGEMLVAQTQPVQEMVNYADEIFTHISRANFANVLTLSKHIHFENKDTGEFDPDLFFKVLKHVAYTNVKSNEPASYEIFGLTRQLVSDNTQIKQVDKKMLFENFLVKLKRISI